MKTAAPLPILRCKYCPAEFKERGIPIIGVSRDQRLAKLTEEAGQHISRVHHVHFLNLMDMTGKVGFVWLMMHTTTTDEDLNRQRDMTAAEFVRTFGKNVTDDELKAAIDKMRGAGKPLELKELPLDMVLALMKQLRDLMRYEHLFPPPEPKPTKEMPEAA